MASASQTSGTKCHEGKEDRREGLCRYVNKVWWSNAVSMDWLNKCQISIFFFIVGVHTAPDANQRDPLQELYYVITSNMTKQPDGIF